MEKGGAGISASSVRPPRALRGGSDEPREGPGGATTVERASAPSIAARTPGAGPRDRTALRRSAGGEAPGYRCGGPAARSGTARTGRRRPERNHPEPDRYDNRRTDSPAIRGGAGVRGPGVVEPECGTAVGGLDHRMFVQAGAAPTLCRPPRAPRELEPGRWAATGAGGTPSVGIGSARGASRLVHGNTDCRVQLSSREPSDGRETLPCGRRSGRLSATTTRETPQR